MMARRSEGRESVCPLKLITRRLYLVLADESVPSNTKRENAPQVEVKMETAALQLSSSLTTRAL